MRNATFVSSALSWHTSRAVKCRGCWGFSAKVYTESINYISFNQGGRVRICTLALELASGRACQPRSDGRHIHWCQVTYKTAFAIAANCMKEVPS